MKEKIKRLVIWSKGGKVGPLSLEIWPTNRCNLKCVMCGTWASRRKAMEKGLIYKPEEEKKRELPDKIWLKIVDEAIKLDVKEFLITGGGEPLMRKGTVIKLMEKIKECGAYGTLNTNGTLLSQKDVLKFINIGWDMIIFSLDGPNGKTHDAIRNVKGTFNKVKKILLEIKKQKIKLKVEKPKVVFNTVILNKNFEKLQKLVEFASLVGCEDITFIPLITFDKSVEKYKLSSLQRFKLSKIIDRVEKLSQQLGVHTNILQFRENPIGDTSRMNELILSEVKSSSGFASIPCYEPFLHLLITPDGLTTSCCMLAGKGVKEDFTSKGLKDIWFGEWFNNLREQFLRKELPIECGTCVFSQFIRNKELREEISRLI